MERVRKRTVLLLAVLATACVSVMQGGPAAGEAAGARRQDPAAPNPVTLVSGHAQSGSNVAALGRPGASNYADLARLAFDGDPESVWNSRNFPTQWISVRLDRPYLVERVEFVVTQAPPAPTTHELWLLNGSGVRTRYTQLVDVHTEDGQTLAFALSPPRILTEALMLTRESPSWVAWREVRVFALDAEDKTAYHAAVPD